MSNESNTAYPSPSIKGIEVEEIIIDTIEVHGVIEPVPESGVHYRGSMRHIGVQSLLPNALRYPAARERTA
jgi:hypothetical protein